MITAHDLIGWLRWADAATSDAERDARAQRIQKYMFPTTLEDEERVRRQKVFEHVKKIGEPPSWDGWPAPTPVPDDGMLPPLPPLEWEGLIPEKSPAYRRASRRDGTGAEVDRMRRQARGTPFYDDEKDEKKDSKKG